MTTIPVAEARANLSKLVDVADTTHERIEITKNGRRAAVLIGADDFDAMQETLEILASEEAVKTLRFGLDDVRQGNLYSPIEVEQAMKAAGRDFRNRK